MNGREVPAAVVITGASTGIGRATALHLDRLGYRVFAGVRREADADGLRSESSERLAPVLLDVTDIGSIEAAAKTVSAEVGERGLAGLVNNAGIALGGPLEFMPLDELRRQLEVNTIGPVAVTQHFLPLVRQGRGRIVFVSSVGGRFSNPIIGPYSASKFALEALADALRMELAPSGIHVSLIEPGAVKTMIFEKAGPYGDLALARLPEEGKRLYGKMGRAVLDFFAKMERSAIPPDRVARVIEHALTAARPRTRYLVGIDARIQALLAWLLPDRTRDALVGRLMGLPR
ncbi:MAG TPA: SDR family NAD(P)-dependent oxidoreductase [Myxococcota bacterium]|nr:SDR family NAD(P)-dependent oxidoreductase [Myxococcota bacterium]